MNTRIAQACLLTAAALSTTAYARPHGLNHPYQDTSNPHQHTQNEHPSHQATQPQTYNTPRSPNTNTQTRAPAQYNPQQSTTTYTTYTYDNYQTNTYDQYPRTYPSNRNHQHNHYDYYQRPITTTHYQPIRITHPQIQQRLPIAYRGHHGQAYEIHNWHQHHQLYAPPQGARWMVSVDGDFILASILTGVIYSILR